MTHEQMKELAARLRLEANRQGVQSSWSARELTADLNSAADLIRQMAERQDAPIAIPTREMLMAARDWSIKKYEKAIGNDAAEGCWRAMLAAAPPAPQPARVPLTEQEIWDAVMHGAIGGIGLVSKAVSVARAIEAAHGIRSEE